MHFRSLGNHLAYRAGGGVVEGHESIIAFVGSRLALVLVFVCASVFSSLVHAQQGAEPLAIQTTSLPKAYLKQHYETRLLAHGGIPPVSWEVTEGTLPAGIVLGRDGILSGAPTETGEFKFTVTVTDTGRPAVQRNQLLVLMVVAPLMLQWGRYPKITGRRLEGSVLVSNGTEQDFDLTVIIMAVNDIGRATAIGYQHFTLKKDTAGTEIPFGESLPQGSYQLNVDAVAEVAATDSIYRARLVPSERFQMLEGP
jgi:Putative Ig domain